MYKKSHTGSRDIKSIGSILMTSVDFFQTFFTRLTEVRYLDPQEKSKMINQLEETKANINQIIKILR